MLSAGRPVGPPLPLLWRVFLANAVMLTVATLALALSPATVSFPIALTEVLVLGGGLAAILGLDLALLRRWLAPSHIGTPVGSATVGRVSAGPRLLADASQDEPSIDAAESRLLVCWAAPDHLSDLQAGGWARTS